MKKKTTIQSYELLSFANRKSKIVDVLIFYINLTQRRALRRENAEIEKWKVKK